ncbi:MAG: hypothetical protein ABIH11_02715 [Candidatus Altiarchaeota archaeon]
MMELSLSTALKRGFQLLFLLSIISSTAASISLKDAVGSMCELADALGLLVIGIMGARWVIADSAQERSEAKKGIIYVVVGLLVVHSMGTLMTELYINPANAAGISISLGPGIPSQCQII